MGKGNIMPHNKIIIDLDKLDQEISDFDILIDQAVKGKAMKVQLRDYILKTYSSPIVVQGSMSLSSQVGKSEPPKKRIRRAGVSDFFANYIKNNEDVSTATLCEVYAEHIHVANDVVNKKNVSRFLAKLKKNGVIANRLKSGARRAGSNWIYVEDFNKSIDESKLQKPQLLEAS